MGPHDLLCKWCSTFVGKDKQFCSIFCESRHTRSKRRKLAYKRPVQSSGPGGHHSEFVSPRASNTAPSKKQFLEDVLTAMKMEDDKTYSSLRGKTEDDTMSKDSQTSGSSRGTPRRSAIPRLDMSKLKDKTDKNERSTKSDKHDKEASKPEYKLKSKTHTIYVHPKKDKKVEDSRKPVISSAKAAPLSKPVIKTEKSKTQTEMKGAKESDIKSDVPKFMDGKSKTSLRNAKSESMKSNTQIDLLGSNKESTLLKEKSKKVNTNSKAELDTKTQSQKTNQDKSVKSEEDKSDEIEPLPRQQSKVANELADRVRSSGYGAPVNPRLRPVSLKPRSANMQTSKVKRESSASSTKSASLGLTREKSRPIASGKGQSKWELVQTPIKEEQKTKDAEVQKEKTTNTTLEHEDPSPVASSRVQSKVKESPRTTTKQEHVDQSPQTSFRTRSKLKEAPRRELQSIDELLREESTGSILDASVLQSRLSSIKRKVEVRRRGRDSRSSVGSDLDSTLDTSIDTTTGRDKLNTSFGDPNTPASTSRASARSNITRISKEFRSTKVN